MIPPYVHKYGYFKRTEAGEVSLLNEGDTLPKAVVGLDKVDNTADASKPVSTLQQAALDALTDPVLPRACWVDAAFVENVWPKFKDWPSARAALLARTPAPDPTCPAWATLFSAANSTPISIGVDTPASLAAMGIILRDGTDGISIIWKGAWSGSIPYAVNDAVSLGGSSYICILAHTNQTPPNGTYWAVLAAKGADGADGADIKAITPITRILDTVYQNTKSADVIIVATVEFNNVGDDSFVGIYVGATSPPDILFSTMGMRPGDSSQNLGLNTTFVVPAGWYYKLLDSSEGLNPPTLVHCVECSR